MIDALTQNQNCALAFVLGVAAIFICARFLKFTDNWPDSPA